MSVKFDDDDTKKPGWKFAEYELKGVPIRLAFGNRDFDNNTVEVARRDTGDKQTIGLDGVATYIEDLLATIQKEMFDKSLNFQKTNTSEVSTYEEFKKVLDTKGGFILAHWDGTNETEKRIKDETKATIRCIPFDQEKEEGKCMVTGNKSEGKVLFARAY